ncbi:MAG: D-glycero-beta-D-manno-heptose 1-phosphate adenylyltransferase [Desulfobacterales bacterium]|nr:MAG: D-glycero-beta-D-manno-heptose 1-phosphate adenylyltransferase [Desulfobacterales bacterium]
MAQKFCSLDQMNLLCQDYKNHGKTIVFTNGCFDIIHAGHVSYLGRAASLGDVLILGLNSDASVRSIKGDKRPVICEEHRIQVVCALECVHHVVLFDAPDPLELITTIRPHVLVKGADWPEDQIVGADFVRQHQGRVERISLEPGLSTTRIIQRIGVLYYGQ